MNEESLFFQYNKKNQLTEIFPMDTIENKQ
jgi:hypothetical protein